MSRMKRLELTNFRNIKHLVLEFKSNPVIINGDNGIGKSNVLCAESWFFTDALFSDKWGTGENDINSIIPIDQKKGEHEQGAPGPCRVYPGLLGQIRCHAGSKACAVRAGGASFAAAAADGG